MRRKNALVDQEEADENEAIVKKRMAEFPCVKQSEKEISPKKLSILLLKLTNKQSSAAKQTEIIQ